MIIIIPYLLCGCSTYTVYESRIYIDYNPHLDYNDTISFLKEKECIEGLSFEKKKVKNNTNSTIENASYYITGNIKVKESSSTFQFGIGDVDLIGGSEIPDLKYSDYENKTTTRIYVDYSEDGKNLDDDLKATMEWFIEEINNEFNRDPINSDFKHISTEYS